MASNNMINVAIDPSIEDKLFADEVEAVKKWWSDPRWRYTKRPFTPEQIVSKRGNLKVEYPSNAQSKKLWNILEKRFKVSFVLLGVSTPLCACTSLLTTDNAKPVLQERDASYTYGCLEPTMVTQMAKYLDTIYVSGWQSSSTASSSDEPGPDLADYPYVSQYRA